MRDKKGTGANVTAKPPLPIELVVDRPNGKPVELQGEGFKQLQDLKDKQSGQMTLLFSTGTGRVTIRSAEN
jgi:hypothetical protein